MKSIDTILVRNLFNMSVGVSSIDLYFRYYGFNLYESVPDLIVFHMVLNILAFDCIALMPRIKSTH